MFVNNWLQLEPSESTEFDGKIAETLSFCSFLLLFFRFLRTIYISPVFSRNQAFAEAERKSFQRNYEMCSQNLYGSNALNFLSILQLLQHSRHDYQFQIHSTHTYRIPTRSSHTCTGILDDVEFHLIPRIILPIYINFQL